MAAVNFNINLADSSTDGLATGPYTSTVKRGATAPSDGTALFAGSADTVRNIQSLLDQAFFYIGNYVAGLNESDPDN